VSVVSDVDDIRDYYDLSLLYLLHDRLDVNPRHVEIGRLIERVVPRGASVLDLGCGIGITCERARKRARRVVGVDLAPTSIDYATKTVTGVDFLAGDIVSLRLGERFDVVCLFDALEHIPSTRRHELWTTIDLHLADCGTVVITSPHPLATVQNLDACAETLQIVDEVLFADVILAETREHRLFPRELRTYGIDRDPQYVSLVLERARPPVARQWPPLSYARDRIKVRLLARGYLKAAETVTGKRVTREAVRARRRQGW
jgi:2-polyprenyl-3-methyl-5-hydroxy-6-metoxy-1,4-benzoquinol methylase